MCLWETFVSLVPVLLGVFSYTLPGTSRLSHIGSPCARTLDLVGEGTGHPPVLAAGLCGGPLIEDILLSISRLVYHCLLYFAEL